jgi:hypothetical protein
MIAMRAGALGVIVGLFGCGFSPHESAMPADGHDDGMGDVAPTAWLAGYHYRKAITVTTALTGPLADFPLGLVRAQDPELAAHASGDDLVVTSGDALTPLDRELVTSAVNGSIELWVHVPSLRPGAQTFYLYYGGAAATSSRSMWSTTAGVWHLSEPGMTAGDSGPHAHTLAASGPMQTPMPKPGIAGGARSYDGNDDSYGTGDPLDGSLDVGTSSFSFTMWLQVTQPAGTFDTPFWKGGTSTAEPGFCVITGSQYWNVKIHDGINYVDPELGTATALENQWVHVAGVVDRGAQRFTAYANGAQASAMSITGIGSLDNTFNFDLGRPKPTGVFEGMLDEVRLYPRVLTADWIAAEHANLADPSFVGFGPEEMR